MSITKFTAYALTAVLAAQANAYVVFTDQALFEKSYENPTSHIDFSTLKDGTVFRTDGYLYSPLITTTSSHYASVREEGWDSDILIGSTYPNCGCAWGATNWYGDYIEPVGYTYFNYIYINTGREATPVALDTSAGFLAFAPDNLDDGFYLLPYGVTVSDLWYGFSKALTVSEPSSLALLFGGLFALCVGAMRRFEFGFAQAKRNLLSSHFKKLE